MEKGRKRCSSAPPCLHIDFRTKGGRLPKSTCPVRKASTHLNELQGHNWMSTWYAGVRSAFAMFQTMRGNTELSTLLSLFLWGVLLFLSAFNTKYCDCICKVFYSNILRSVSLWFVSNETLSNGNKEAESCRETSSKCCLESSVVAASSSRKSLHFVGC